MKRILGISLLLLAIIVVTAIGQSSFLTANNLQNQFRWIGLFGLLSIGVSFVIITGGIDLSIGSVVGLVGTLLPLMVNPDYLNKHVAALFPQGMNAFVACGLVLALSALLGLGHGLLITKLRLQPFVVTLCGLLFYRGVARGISGDGTLGFGKGFDSLLPLASGRLHVGFGFGIPTPFIIMMLVAIAAAVLLNLTIYGRYMLALGRNEQAARYSGVNTDRMTVLAYVLCSFTAGLGGMLLSFDGGSIQPDKHGNFYELYAIAAAVLGGCNLRGGEGYISGVVIGTAALQLLNNSLNLLGSSDKYNFAVIGAVILATAIVDEMIRLLAARRRAVAQARAGPKGA